MIVRLFERDARHQVLWFSGPPLAPGTIPVPERPAHSLEYLKYVAKRKRNEPTEKKVFKREGPGVVEPEWPKAEMWWAEGMTEEQVNDALKATMGG
jgi:chromatin structure-remodeling complex subunit RSC1/2